MMFVVVWCVAENPGQKRQQNWQKKGGNPRDKEQLKPEDQRTPCKDLEFNLSGNVYIKDEQKTVFTKNISELSKKKNWKNSKFPK